MEWATQLGYMQKSRVLPEWEAPAKLCKRPLKVAQEIESQLPDSASARCPKGFLLPVEQGIQREWGVQEERGEESKWCRLDLATGLASQPASPIRWLARCLPRLSSAHLLLPPPHVAKKTKGSDSFMAPNPVWSTNSWLCYEKGLGWFLVTCPV